MVLASVTVLGVLGAAVGVPTGIVLHRYIVTIMGRIAASTGIPDGFFHVFGPGLLTTLAAAAIVPAAWAARSPITEVLQAE